MKLSEIINELLNIRLAQATNRYYYARSKEQRAPDMKRIEELNAMLDDYEKPKFT